MNISTARGRFSDSHADAHSPDPAHLSPTISRIIITARGDSIQANSTHPNASLPRLLAIWAGSLIQKNQKNHIESRIPIRAKTLFIL